jgi:hypothetical protein
MGMVMRDIPTPQTKVHRMERRSQARLNMSAGYHGEKDAAEKL